jgi:hypothetical protein
VGCKSGGSNKNWFNENNYFSLMVRAKNNLKNVFSRFHCDDSNAKSRIVVCSIATEKTYANRICKNGGCAGNFFQYVFDISFTL